VNNLATHKLTLLVRLAVCLFSLACLPAVAVAQRGGGAVALVPQRAVAIAKLNWNLVRSDAQFRSMLNANQLDRALNDLNINGSQISEIVIFSGINTTPSGLVGGIFDGSYDAAAVKASLESRSFRKKNYLGRVLYCNDADGSCTSLLRSGRLLVGTQQAVEGVIDVEANPRSALTLRKPFTTMLRKFVLGRQPISFAMALPLEYQMVAEVGVKVVAALFNFSGLGPLGFVIDKIGLPQAIGFAITRSSSNFPVELTAKMKDEQSAALISGTFNLAQSLNFEMFASRMSAADRDRLKNVSVVRQGTVLQLKILLRSEDLQAPQR
jgi:hypothetical protein